MKDLIDGLRDITKTISTAVRQERTFIHRIQQVEDVDTLHFVSIVCINLSAATPTLLNIPTNTCPRKNSYRRSNPLAAVHGTGDLYEAPKPELLPTSHFLPLPPEI